jgi:hypothetical protein
VWSAQRVGADHTVGVTLPAPERPDTASLREVVQLAIAHSEASYKDAERLPVERASAALRARHERQAFGEQVDGHGSSPISPKWRR